MHAVVERRLVLNVFLIKMLPSVDDTIDRLALEQYEKMFKIKVLDQGQEK